MFTAINPIDADRKNSLPVADFSKRYVKTATPVVFGDLTYRWPAKDTWNPSFLRSILGDTQVSIYSNKVNINAGNSLAPVDHISAADYFTLLDKNEDDLQIRNFPIFKHRPELAEDIVYPRLGLTFKPHCTRLQMGGTGAKINMHYRADLAETLLCNFGGRQVVLLVKPEQAKFTYEPLLGFESVPTVDYSASGLEKNPAISHLQAYYAELSHGDVLYIPSGYRYSVTYLSTAVGLTLVAEPLTVSSSVKAVVNSALIQPLDRLGFGLLGQHWYRRKLRGAVRRSKR